MFHHEEITDSNNKPVKPDDEIIIDKLAELESSLKEFDPQISKAAIELRSKETENLGTEQQQKYLEFLDEQIRLIKAMAYLKSIKTLSPGELKDSSKSAELINNALQNFVEEVQKVQLVLEKLTENLLQSPYSLSLSKDLKLLADTTSSVGNFYRNPDNPSYFKNVISCAQQIYKKTGLFWRGLKTTLTAVIGVACIVIGALGIAPSLGISVTLIAIGAAMCASLGMPAFKTPVNEKIKNSEALYKNMLSMMTKAQRLLQLEKNPERLIINEIVIRVPKKSSK
jgi:hypothetical protein